MAKNNLKIYLFALMLVTVCAAGSGQNNVPYGIHYQAVARDNYGKELVNKTIDVRFSIKSENPLGTDVYQELHSDITTSKYGVFSLVIGQGTPTGGLYENFSQINWAQSFHYLKVEVKFDNDFVDMGTMQFLAVPYALFAQKSLEPGPQGLQGVPGQKGDPGDPASDDQTLSFNGDNLSISDGNTVNLSTLNIPHQLSILGDTLSIMGGNKVGLLNQIQDLQLDVNNKLKISKNPSATEIDLTKFLDDKQQLNFNSVNNTLNITGGNTVDLTPMKQDLILTDNSLTITNKVNPATIDLSKYLQQLSFTGADNKLSIVGGNTVDLSSLKNDADADPANEIQDLNLTGNNLTINKNSASLGIDLSKYDNSILTYNQENFQLAVSHGSSIAIGSILAFRAGITASFNMPNNTPIDLIFDQVTGTNYYNEGGNYNPASGTFQASCDGIYSFFVTMNLPIGSSSMIIKLSGSNFETIIGPTSASGYFRANLTLKLSKNDIVNVALVQNNGFSINPYIISGTFSGFRVY